MEFKEIQAAVLDTADKYSKKYGIELDKEFCALKLTEELGEFAEAALTHAKKSRPEKFTSDEESKKRLAHELADVVGMAIVTANAYGIDLEEALKEKWMKKHANE